MFSQETINVVMSGNIKNPDYENGTKFLLNTYLSGNRGSIFSSLKAISLNFINWDKIFTKLRNDVL